MTISFRKTLFAILFIFSAISSVHGKSAILLCHYGSSNSETRSKTIDLITDEVRDAFPRHEVRDAYISPIVRRSLSRSGVSKDSPATALLRLSIEGYDTVYVQSSTLLDGTEMAAVRAAVEETKRFFNHVTVGRPLLYSPADCLKVTEILARETCGADEAIIYVGHGNDLPSTASYCELDYMLGLSTCNGHYGVSTIEGYPTATTTVSRLKANPHIKNVRLIPLLLVCGNHALNDIDIDFTDTIRSAGYECKTEFRGLGENPLIRAIYIQRVRELIASSVRLCEL